jgi:hypothetical protein
VSAAPDGSAVGDKLAAAIRAAIGTDIPPGMSFFEAGLTSATVVSIHERLQRELGRQFPVTTFFEHPTVRDLARHLAGSPRLAEPEARPGTATQNTGQNTGQGSAAHRRRALRAHIRQRKG